MKKWMVLVAAAALALMVFGMAKAPADAGSAGKMPVMKDACCTDDGSCSKDAACKPADKACAEAEKAKEKAGSECEGGVCPIPK
jgi:hypothetical protein